MTTIAWDGRTLAADRLLNAQGTRRTTKKIHECGDYYYAGAGMLDDVWRIAEWIRAGANPETRPTFEEGGGWGLAILRGSGAPFLVTGKRPVITPMVDPFHAEGSGRDFALAAMMLGKSAADAVRLASKLDLSTGGEVDELHFNATKGR